MIPAINSGKKWKLENVFSRLRDHSLKRSPLFRVREIEHAAISASDNKWFGAVFDGELDILVIKDFITADEHARISIQAELGDIGGFEPLMIV